MSGSPKHTDGLEVLALVEGQIEEVYNQLDLQMKRMSQIQTQLDEMRATVRQLTRKNADTSPGKSSPED
jgi:chaperonin cofactor prefoldin